MSIGAKFKTKKLCVKFQKSAIDTRFFIYSVYVVTTVVLPCKTNDEVMGLHIREYELFIVVVRKQLPRVDDGYGIDV